MSSNLSGATCNFASVNTENLCSFFTLSDVHDLNFNHLLSLFSKTNLDPRTTFILDSGSNCNIIKDVNLLSNVKSFTQSQQIAGLNGSENSQYEGELGFLKKVYIVPDAPLNILSLSDLMVNYAHLVSVQLLKNGFSITNMTDKNSIVFNIVNGLFIAQKQDVLIFFNGNIGNNIENITLHSETNNSIQNNVPNNYEAKLPNSNYSLNNNNNNVSITHNNYTINLTDLYIINTFHSLHMALCHPGKSMFIKSLKNMSSYVKSLHKNYDERKLFHYIKLMDLYFGECDICKIGNVYTTKSPSDDFYAIKPAEKIHSDIIFLGSKLSFLLFIDEYTQISFIYSLMDKKSETILKNVLNLQSYVEFYNHKWENFYFDHEINVFSLKDVLAKHKIKLICNSPGSHNSLAERKTKQLKEKILMILYSTPYHIPLCFMKYMVSYIIQAINITANTKNDISPKEMFTGIKPKFYNLNYYFGEIVYCKQVNRSKSTNKLHIGIVLARDMDSQGNVLIYDLDSKALNWRREFFKLKTIDINVVNYVNLALQNLEKFNYNYTTIFNNIISNNHHNNIKIQNNLIHNAPTTDPTPIQTTKNVNASHIPINQNVSKVTTDVIGNNSNTADETDEQQNNLHNTTSSYNDHEEKNNNNHSPSMINTFSPSIIPAPPMNQFNGSHDDWDIAPQLLLDDPDRDVHSDIIYYETELLYKARIPGTSSYKYMVHYKGYPSSQDEWASTNQLQGYTRSELLKVPTQYKYFKNNSNINSSPPITNNNDTLSVDDTNSAASGNQVNVDTLLDKSSINSSNANDNSQQNINSSLNSFFLFCYTNITLTESLKNDQELTIQSAYEELDKLVNMDTFLPLSPTKINSDVISKTVLTFLFFKEKKNTQNVMTRYKSRLVVNGARQPVNTYNKDLLYCGTLKRSSLFILLNIAAFYDLDMYTLDVGNAFIESDLKDTIYVKLDKFCSNIIVSKIRPEWINYLTYDGCMYAKLAKSLYGLVQAPYMWSEHLNTILIEFGLVRSKNDPCVYFKYGTNGKVIMYLGIHIDDALVLSSDKTLVDQFNQHLYSKFKKVTINPVSDILEYLGLRLVRNRMDKSISIDQIAFIDDALSKYETKSYSNYPLYRDLFFGKNENSSRCIPEKDIQAKRKFFLAKLMKINYCSYSRPDLIPAISLLASKTHKLNENDFLNLNKLYSFINLTRNDHIVIKPKDLNVTVYVDASFSLHPNDYVGQTGYIVSFGELHPGWNGLITSKSLKQKQIGKSSFECELYAINSAVEEVLWIKEFLNEIAINTNNPIKVYEDNLPTINALKKGSGSYKKSKFIGLKAFWIKNYIDNKTINLKHIESESNISDYNTKILQNPLFSKFRNLILNKN